MQTQEIAERPLDLAADADVAPSSGSAAGRSRAQRGPGHSSEALARELDGAQSELTRLRRTLENAERQHRRSVAEYATRNRRLQQTVSALSVGLSHVRDDVERAQSSHAWRLGHGVSRTLARLAGRRRATQGALAAALARIERVQSATHAQGAGSSAMVEPGRAPVAGAAGADAEWMSGAAIGVGQSSRAARSALPLSAAQQSADAGTTRGAGGATARAVRARARAGELATRERDRPHAQRARAPGVPIHGSA